MTENSQPQRDLDAATTELEEPPRYGLLDSVLENTVQAAYNKIPDPSREAREWGPMLHQAGFATTPGGGAAVAMICFTEGISFREFKRKYHTFDGTLTMRADAAYADYLAQGGKVKWLQQDNEACVGSFTHGDFEDVNIAWTIEEAKEAGLYPRKDNWKNYTSDMLFSRCLMRGLRRVAPNIVAGAYDPDEIETSRAETKKTQQAVADRRKELAELAAEDVAGGSGGSAESRPAPTESPAPATSPPLVDQASGSISPQSSATTEQLNTLADLGMRAGFTLDDCRKIFADQYGCRPDMSDLTRESADDAIAKLEAAIAEKQKQYPVEEEETPF